MARRRVVVLGGGVAGVMAAQRLEQQAGADLEVTLVARRAWGPVAPLLAPVAVGALDPRLALAPLRPRLRRARLVVASVSTVDTVSRQVLLEGDEVRAGLAQARLPYDELVVALGAAPVHDPLALPFAGAASTLALRERLAQALAAASAEDSPRKRRLLTTVVVLGAGASAAALAASLLTALRAAAADWPRLLPDEPRVVLVTAGALLPGAPPALASAVGKALAARGVELRAGAVQALAPDHVKLEGDERIETRTVIAAGLAPRAPDCLGPLRGPDGRVAVASSLASATFAGLWAIGACASVADAPADGAPTVDDLAAQADLLARNLVARATGAVLIDRPAAPRLRLLGLAPDLGAGSLGPLPLPAALAWRLHLGRELLRSWPASSPLLWLAPTVPGLPPSLPLASPASLLLTPPPPLAAAPGSTLPLPALPFGAPSIDSATTPGLPPFTLPLPPPPRRG